MASLLQRHVGGALDQVRRVAVGDAREGLHRAGDDDHTAPVLRARGEGRAEVVLVVQTQPARPVGLAVGRIEPLDDVGRLEVQVALLDQQSLAVGRDDQLDVDVRPSRQALSIRTA